MAKAIFERDFHWNRTPPATGFFAKASPEPQSFPKDFVAAAVSVGAATEVPPKQAKPKAK